MFQSPSKSGRWRKGKLCPDFEADLFDLLDGELAAERTAGLMCHLGECQDCSVLFRALVFTDALLRELFEENKD